MSNEDIMQCIEDCHEKSYDINEVKITSGDVEKFDYENLVFEGGGIRGIAFGGVIKCLESLNLIKSMKRVAGSSAGAIVAAALAIGYTGEEIIEILDKTNFNSFKDDTRGLIFDIYRFVTQYGIYKGDVFLSWFQSIVKSKTGSTNTTFKEVFERYNIELVITGTCLNRAETYYFHHTTYPDMPIALAVRISMSIPLVFKAVTLKRHEPRVDQEGNQVYDNGKPVVDEYEDVMVDGGLLNNYPIWVFDGDTIGDDNVSDEKIRSSKTLGFKLMSDSEKKDYRLYHINEKIENLVSYFTSFVNSMTIQIERGHIRSGYWENTVCINTGNVSSMNFDISNNTKEQLIKSGYDSTKNHFYCRLRSIPNKWNEIK